jgi:hypothetical protein
MKC